MELIGLFLIQLTNMPYSQVRTLMSSAVVGQTTTAMVAIGDRRIGSLQFTASGITSGNGVFQVQISNNGSNWVYYNRLTSNVTNTNGQTDTRVASFTLSANGSVFAFLPPTDTFQYLRVICTRTTDGSYGVILSDYSAG